MALSSGISGVSKDNRIIEESLERAMGIELSSETWVHAATLELPYVVEHPARSRMLLRL